MPGMIEEEALVGGEGDKVTDCTWGPEIFFFLRGKNFLLRKQTANKKLVKPGREQDLEKKFDKQA